MIHLFSEKNHNHIIFVSAKNTWFQDSISQVLFVSISFVLSMSKYYYSNFALTKS